MSDYLSNYNLFETAWKWKWHFIIIGIVVVLLASVFSSPFFITPKYKSNAVIYPSNLSSYSEESETEQMLQWLHSNEIKDSIIAKYHLASHYGIDSNNKYFYSNLLHTYNQHININRTEYQSANIEVIDKDPVIAAKIAADIVKFYNRIVRKAHRSKYQEELVIAKNQMNLYQKEMDSIGKKLDYLRNKYEIIDYNNQTREITRGFLRTFDGANHVNLNKNDILRLKNNIEKKGGEFIKYNRIYLQLLKDYSEQKNRYFEALRDYEKELTYANYVNKPYPADKKSAPVRWLIVLISLISAEFLALIIIFITEKHQSSNK